MVDKFMNRECLLGGGLSWSEPGQVFGDQSALLNRETKVTKTTTTTPHKTEIDYRTEPTETDPNGKSLNEPGAKGDAGKLLPALVLGDFARALIQVSEVGTYGAKKYTAHGWLTVPNGIERYEEAMMRHWLKEKAGEDTDPDTGLLHQAHLAWNALARLDLMLREQEAKQ